MQTASLTPSELIIHLEDVLSMLKTGEAEAGTISWNKTSLGTYDVIAFVQVTGEGAITIGEVTD